MRLALQANTGIRGYRSPAYRGHIHFPAFAALLMLQQPDRPVVQLTDFMQYRRIAGLALLNIEPKQL
jgi:hypothetical protein